MMDHSNTSTSPVGAAMKLSAADIALLDSQLPEIGGAIRNKPVTPDGDGWRVGSSTKISKNGRWFDFKAQQGGFGAVSFITHYRTCTPEEAVAWAQSWLAQHPQRGPCGGADEDDGAGEDSADTLQRRAYIESTYAARRRSRARLRPPTWPAAGSIRRNCVPRSSSAWAGFPTTAARKAPWCFPTPTRPGGCRGCTSSSSRRAARNRRMNRPARRAGDRLTGAPPAARCCASTSAQGRRWSSWKGLRTRSRSRSRAPTRVVAVGAVGAYGRCRLPRTVEAIVIAHDGDDPDAKPAAAQAYHRGVVRYLGQGLTLRMTAPPIGCDPNDVLKLGGHDRPQEAPNRSPL